jgi:hypothetical protein
MTPPVGPDTAMWIGVCAAASKVISPPLDLINAARSGMPAAASRSRMRVSREATFGFR